MSAAVFCVVVRMVCGWGRVELWAAGRMGPAKLGQAESGTRAPWTGPRIGPEFVWGVRPRNPRNTSLNDDERFWNAPAPLPWLRLHGYGIRLWVAGDDGSGRRYSG